MGDIGAGILEQSIGGGGGRNRVGIGLLYRPAKIHRLLESIPWNRFLGPIKVLKYRLRIHNLAEFVPWNRFLGSLKV
jgi:hypothetical protein